MGGERAVRSYKVGRDAPGRLRGGWRRQCLTQCRKQSRRLLPSAKKQNPPTQPAGRDPGRRACGSPRRARERGGLRVPRIPGGGEPARPPAPLPAPARPHVADPARPLTVAPRSFPRGGPQRLPQSEHHPAAGHVEPARSSRLPRSADTLARSGRERAEAGEEEGRGCQRRRPVLRRIRSGGRHCASSPTSLLWLEAELSADGGGRVTAASSELPAECQLEEGKGRRRRRRGRGGGGEHSPPHHPPTPGAGRAGRACPPGTRGGLWRRAAGSGLPHLGSRSVPQPLGVGEGRPLRGPAP